MSDTIPKGAAVTHTAIQSPPVTQRGGSGSHPHTAARIARLIAPHAKINARMPSRRPLARSFFSTVALASRSSLNHRALIPARPGRRLAGGESGFGLGSGYGGCGCIPGHDE